jgi:hypothetical protein
MRGPDAHDARLLDEQAEWLFRSDRLARRFLTLERICLASVAAQTDPDFRFLVITSARLPHPWLDRLRALCATIPQAELVVTRETELGAVLRPILMRSAADTGRRHCNSGWTTTMRYRPALSPPCAGSKAVQGACPPAPSAFRAASA